MFVLFILLRFISLLSLRSLFSNERQKGVDLDGRGGRKGQGVVEGWR